MIRHRPTIAPACLMLALSLVACGRDAPVPTTLPTPPDSVTSVSEIITSEPTDAAVTAGCFEAPAGMQLYTSTEFGYCLHYPTGFQVEASSAPGLTMISGPVPQEGTQARAFIRVEDAAGRTAEEVAEALVAEAEPIMAPTPVAAEPVTLGGEPAILVRNLPGQDINRRVVLVRGDKLFDLMFVAFEEGRPEPTGQAEALFGAVMGSFGFLPGD